MNKKNSCSCLRAFVPSCETLADTAAHWRVKKENSLTQRRKGAKGDETDFRAYSIISTRSGRSFFSHEGTKARRHEDRNSNFFSRFLKEDVFAPSRLGVSSFAVMSIKIIPLVLCFAWLKASAFSQEITPESPTTVCWKAGDKDAQGLVLYVVKDPKTGVQRPSYLRSDFGVMCAPFQFRLAQKNAGTVSDFTSYRGFLDALKKLPKGSTITIYDFCLRPLFYDFAPVHEEFGAKFRKDCRSLGLKIAKDDRRICTCPEP